jgi:hypothetical protein
LLRTALLNRSLLPGHQKRSRDDQQQGLYEGRWQRPTRQ